jgi:hypothetical protein
MNPETEEIGSNILYCIFQSDYAPKVSQRITMLLKACVFLKQKSEEVDVDIIVDKIQEIRNKYNWGVYEDYLHGKIPLTPELSEKLVIMTKKVYEIDDLSSRILELALENGITQGIEPAKLKIED